MVTTFLFVPAYDARKTAKALASSADAVILDLEDAVPDEMKGSAREAAAATLRGRTQDRPQIWIRVNATHSSHHEADLRAIDWSRADGLLLPKAENPSSVQTIAAFTPRALILTLESIAGFANAVALIGVARPRPRLAIGTWDLAHDLSLPVDDPDESELIWHLRSEMVITSRRLGLHPPVDGVYGRIDDAGGFESMSQRAFHLGFGGKLLIHPAQIPLAARIFTITDAQVAEAKALIDAYEDAQRSGVGAIRHAGQMVDAVHVQRARALLARWHVADRT
jgi:citrate lyase subunit beta/citryl-CoA lyase